MVVVKHLVVRVFGEVEHFHGEELEAKYEIDDAQNNILYITDVKNGKTLGMFYRWEYTRSMKPTEHYTSR